MAMEIKHLQTSEADEISRLRAENAELKEKHKTDVKELLCLIRDKENNFYRAFDSEEKEIRHHKYKRCLAMAMWCRINDEFTQLESERLGLPQRTLFLEYRNKAMWWNKWRKRWLNIAEQFKDKEATK